MRVVQVLVVCTIALVAACGSDTTKQETVAIGGAVTGLQGKGLVLSYGNEQLTVDHDGAFVFDTQVEVGADYVIQIDQQPTVPVQVCTLHNAQGKVEALVPVTDVLVTCAAPVKQSFPVGGTVVGLGGSGLVIRNNGGDDLAITDNGTFTFSTPVEEDSQFAVTVKTHPSAPSQTCTVSGASGTVGHGPVTTVVVDCATDLFTVGGQVSGLEGTVVLNNNGTNPITISGNGSFAFPTLQAAGAHYLVTVKTQPSTPSQQCLVTSGTGQILDQNITSVRVSCTTNKFTVGGTVTGLDGDGLVLQNNGGDNLPIAANGPFTFDGKIASGNPYGVSVLTQPGSPTQTCTITPGTGSGTVGGGNVTSVRITCATNSYTIGGTVTGLVGSGLVLRDNGGDDLPISADGDFTFTTPVASGDMFTVTVGTQPSGPTQNCKVSGGTGRVVSADVTSVVVNCSTTTFTVGGTISGLEGTVVLQNRGGDDLTLTTNGSFAFSPVASGSQYLVTVLTQPDAPSQTCTVTNGSGTVVAANVTSVQVDCETDEFAIKGTVKGLVGDGLVLTNNGGDDLPITGNGPFKFATTIASGQAYLVEVDSDPTGPSQTCTVTNASGVVGTSDVTDVQVECVVDDFTIGGTVDGLSGSGLVLRNTTNGDELTVDDNGTFAFDMQVASGQSYNVMVKDQPTDPWQTCVVTSGGSGMVTDHDIVDIVIDCTTDLHTIGGKVSGLEGTGLVLENNMGDDLAVDADGDFTFPTKLASGTRYEVTVKTDPESPTQTCTVTSATGTVTNVDVTSVKVECATNAYPINVTAVGLIAPGVVLQNNLGDDLPLDADGTYTFGTPVRSGQPYHVTISSVLATLTCTLQNDSGTIADHAVSDIVLTCL